MSMSISVSETQSNGMKISTTTTTTHNNNNEVHHELVKCDCCGMKEECTQAYIDRIRDMYKGRWICGLCSEAIQEEIIRSGRLISIEEALNRQMNFRNKFRCSPPTNTKADLIIAIRELFRRSLDSPRMLRSVPSSPRGRNEDHQIPSLARSESCFPALTG